MASNIVDSSLAAVVGASARNVQFVPTAEDVPRRQAIIATYDPAKTGITNNVPFLSPTSENTGDLTGFGFMAHRLHRAYEIGSQGQVPVYIIPQAQAGGSVAAAGEIDFTGSTGVLAGTLALYIANDRVDVTIPAAATIDNIADAVVARIGELPNLPVTAAKVPVTFEVTITSKTTGPWGNGITLAVNNLPGDETPSGVTVALTQPTGGTGLPDIQDALDGMGTGDMANQDFFTAMVHGYGQDTTTLDAVRDYVGAGNTATGLYSELVSRPFRSLVGDVVAGSAGLTAVTALGNGRKTDRASGVIPVPDSIGHPEEIAAQTMGNAERIARGSAGKGYGGTVLSGVDGGAVANRWTNNYTTGRDLAVKAGSGATRTLGETVTITDLITFYHPDSTPVTSNGYREFANIAKIQNILNSWKTTFEAEKFNDPIIVADASRVSSATDRQFVVDLDTIRDTIVALIKSWERKAWIYQAEFSIRNLTVSLRTGSDGFNVNVPFILSGIGKIYDNQGEFDISTAILL